MKPNQIPSARAQAVALLDIVLEQKRTIDEALYSAPLRGSEPDIKFARMLVLSVLRHLGQLDGVIARYLEKPLPEKRTTVTNALRIGAVQLLVLDTPAHAALNETVALVKAGKDAAFTGLVNAVLQKIAQERPAFASPIKNLPQKMAGRWTNAYGVAAVKAIAEVAATRPPLDLTTKENLASGTRLDAHTLRMPSDHAPVEALAGYDDGLFFVQDIAASYPARMLGDVKGKRVLDVCAAPGGKAAQLARGGAFVTALDRSPARMRTLDENMTRLNCDVEAIIADATEWTPSKPYDAILLDAPCTATGTWRRHPDVVHIVTPADIAELAALQRDILSRAWEWLVPDGKLVYCVCSLEKEEGEAQAEWFLGAHADAALVPVDAATEIPAMCITNGMLRTLPSHLAEQGGMDGFFAACFVKKAN